MPGEDTQHDLYLLWSIKRSCENVPELVVRRRHGLQMLGRDRGRVLGQDSAHSVLDRDVVAGMVSVILFHSSFGGAGHCSDGAGDWDGSGRTWVRKTGEMDGREE